MALSQQQNVMYVAFTGDDDNGHRKIIIGGGKSKLMVEKILEKRNSRAKTEQEWVYLVRTYPCSDYRKVWLKSHLFWKSYIDPSTGRKHASLETVKQCVKDLINEYEKEQDFFRNFDNMSLSESEREKDIREFEEFVALEEEKDLCDLFSTSCRTTNNVWM